MEAGLAFGVRGPDDFYLPRLRYVDPAPYTEVEFERARRFMVEWDLIASDATYEKLVANVSPFLKPP